MSGLHFVVDGNPLPTARPRVVRTNGKVRAFTPADSKAYQTQVAVHCRHAMSLRAHGTFPLKDLVGLQVTFYRDNYRRVDLDNLLKSIMDGMTTAGVWWDDSQVVDLRALKRVSVKEPRAEVSLWTADAKEAAGVEVAP